MGRRCALVVLCVLLVGCSFRPASDPPTTAPLASPTAEPTATPSPTATATPTPSPTATPTPEPTPTPVVYRSTLTGQTLDAPPQRPIAVQIDNAPGARPHIGLTQADLVYETPTEAQLTRFTALYQTHAPEVVGPVRSARLVDLAVVPAHDAMLAYSGASIGVQDRLWNAALDLLVVEGNAAEAGWRDYNRYAPHNLFTSIPALRAVADRFGWSRETTATPMDFGPAPEGGAPSSGVTIPYATGNVEFTWDPGTSTYDRFMGGVPHHDAISGEQISPRNVVVLFMTFWQTDIVEDNLGELSLDLESVGSGTAWVFRDGKRYEVQWQRSSNEDVFHFVDPASGATVPLAEGQTWLCLVPQWLSATPKP